MNFIAQNIYHIYNRGNNKQNIFFKEDNYIYFLKKIRKYIVPHCELLAYVLMPNHFHLLVYTDERSEELLPDLRIARNVLSDGVRQLLSSYSKGINKQEGRTGSLIQQNTKAKCVFDGGNPDGIEYAITCFHYIHQNPWRSGFVNNLEDWHYSSYRDYVGLRNGTLCNKNIVKNKLNMVIDPVNSRRVMNDDSIKNIW